jgi:glutathione S-transferase
VRIFLAEKGVKLPTVEVDMMKGENKSPDYLSKNPMGTMPLLELDDGTQLAESVAICRYIEELHPEPSLLGTTPIERALIEMWKARMRWLSGELAMRSFIAGDRYTIADITVQCALILGKNTGTPIPDDLQHLARWFSNVSKRPTARA